MYAPWMIDRDEARKDMMYRAYRKSNLCEKVRDVYDLVHELPEPAIKTEFRERLVDLFILAKKLSGRLAYYAQKYPDHSGHKGLNIGDNPNVLEKRRIRAARKHENPN